MKEAIFGVVSALSAAGLVLAAPAAAQGPPRHVYVAFAPCAGCVPLPAARSVARAGKGPEGLRGVSLHFSRL